MPATALAAPEDPALLKFKLDNSSQYDDFENLGFDMDHAVENGEGDDIIVSAWVDDEELKVARAHGYEDVGVVHNKENFAAIRAESLADKMAEIDAKKALAENAAGRKGASAAPGRSARSAPTSTRTASASSSRSRRTSTASRMLGRR